MKKLNIRKPLYHTETGDSVHVLYQFPNGNLVVSTLNDTNRAITVDPYGRFVQPSGRVMPRSKVRVANEPSETIEYLSLYPDGSVYQKSCCPVRTSSYGVENLIQIKVTRRGDKIIRKEFC